MPADSAGHAVGSSSMLLRNTHFSQTSPDEPRQRGHQVDFLAKIKSSKRHAKLSHRHADLKALYTQTGGDSLESRVDALDQHPQSPTATASPQVLKGDGDVPPVNSRTAGLPLPGAGIVRETAERQELPPDLREAAGMLVDAELSEKTSLDKNRAIVAIGLSETWPDEEASPVDTEKMLVDSVQPHSWDDVSGQIQDIQTTSPDTYGYQMARRRNMPKGGLSHVDTNGPIPEPQPVPDPLMASDRLDGKIPNMPGALKGFSFRGIGIGRRGDFQRSRSFYTSQKSSFPTLKEFTFGSVGKHTPPGRNIFPQSVVPIHPEDERFSDRTVDGQPASRVEDPMDEVLDEIPEDDSARDGDEMDECDDQASSCESDNGDDQPDLVGMVDKMTSLIDHAEAAVTGQGSAAKRSPDVLRRELQKVKSSAKQILEQLERSKGHQEGTSSVRKDVNHIRMAALQMKTELRSLKKAVDAKQNQDLPRNKPKGGRDPIRSKFLVAIHALFDELLPADDGVLPTARESEIRQYERLEKPQPGLGPQSQPLRVDFTSPGLESSKWNKAVASIFTRSFCKTHGDWSDEKKIKSAFFTYLRHLKDVHRMAINGRLERDDDASRKNRVYRRQQNLLKQRIEVVEHFMRQYQSLKALLPILKQMGTRGTSPDLSDSENVPRGKLTSHHPYARQQLPWRSEEFTRLLHDLDAISKYLRVRNGKRTNGNWPRIREDVPSIAKDDRPVKKLPSNCYDAVWRQGLDEIDAFELDARQPAAIFELPDPLREIADSFRHVKRKEDAALLLPGVAGQRASRVARARPPRRSNLPPPNPPAADPPPAVPEGGREREDRMPVASSSRRVLLPAITFGPWPVALEHTMQAYDSVIKLINRLPGARSLMHPDAVAQDRNPQFAIAFFRDIADRDRVLTAWQGQAAGSVAEIYAHPESVPEPEEGTFVTAQMANAARARSSR
ncbi:hypothetical protein AURDEDRAFT_124050 [Auricularia subglabra TFB-10046 SS5]|nr:hypothetical protein AURDEDRAFT_124050 [Auricularia subglabra TFB-10046 SS5]